MLYVRVKREESFTKTNKSLLAKERSIRSNDQSLRDMSEAFDSKVPEIENPNIRTYIKFLNSLIKSFTKG